jgi:nucleotide-binding universal stress UspA family protein
MRILLATDGSPDARAAVDVLCGWPARPGDVVSVVTVVPVRPVFPTLTEPPAVQALVGAARELVDNETERLREAGHVAEPAVVEGDPSDELLRYAVQSDAELIVLGAQGMSGIQRFRLGAVTQRIAHHADCSVLVVRPPARPLRSLLVTTDGSEAAVEAEEALCILPLPDDVQARVLLILPEPDAEVYARDPELRDRFARIATELRRERESVARSICQEAVERLALANIPAQIEIVSGEPKRDIVAAATRRHADLIVVGAQSRPDLARSLLGSVALAVVHDAPCSVLIGRSPTSCREEADARDRAAPPGWETLS